MPYKVEHTLTLAQVARLWNAFFVVFCTQMGGGGGGGESLCQAFLAETVEIGTKPGSLRDRGHGCFAKKA